jgi:hypothetical protein
MEYEHRLDKLMKFNEQGVFDTPEARDIALLVYERYLQYHQSAWNDKFYIAMRFGLDRERQNKAALGSVFYNGATGYFECRTHHDFDNRKLLIDLGVPDELLPVTTINAGPDYHVLDEPVIQLVLSQFEVSMNERQLNMQYKSLRRIEDSYKF